MRLKPIKPSQKKYAPAAKRAIDRAFKTTASYVRRDFSETVETWERKPTFTVEVTPDGIIGGTDDEIYGYLNDGTPPHVITAHNPSGQLAFQVGGFQSKTRPGIIRSRAGRAASGQLVRPKQVMHPGIEARRWTETIAKRRQKTLQQEIDHNLAKELR